MAMIDRSHKEPTLEEICEELHGGSWKKFLWDLRKCLRILPEGNHVKKTRIRRDINIVREKARGEERSLAITEE